MKSDDLFLCYARQDQNRVVLLYNKLHELRFKPWMDKKKIRSGADWERSIRLAIKNSKYFLLILTKNSYDKEGVIQKEIRWALDFQLELLDGNRFVIPVRLDDCAIPERVAHLHAADLFEPGGFDKLVRDLKEGPTKKEPVENSLNQKVIPPRARALPFGGLTTPCFFPSISGAAKNPLTPLEHLEILCAIGHPLFLVSAYDVIKTDAKDDRIKIMKLLLESIDKGRCVLMDSGNYEKRWLKDKWYKKDFYESLRNTPCHVSFSFDNVEPTGTANQIINEIVSGVRRDQRKGGFNNIIPIVHAKKQQDFPDICVGVADALKPPIIAVPEREIGDGVVECAQAMKAIRVALNQTGRYYPIHLLGTGNPLSILIYVACGADSFDGLDWCQTVVDHKSGLLHHSKQLDFFAEQTPFGLETSMSYYTRLFGHNLLFFESWMGQITDALEGGAISSMLKDFLPTKAALTLDQVLEIEPRVGV